jgi:hypothetical protein
LSLFPTSFALGICFDLFAEMLASMLQTIHLEVMALVFAEEAPARKPSLKPALWALMPSAN